MNNRIKGDVKAPGEPRLPISEMSKLLIGKNFQTPPPPKLKKRKQAQMGEKDRRWQSARNIGRAEVSRKTKKIATDTTTISNNASMYRNLTVVESGMILISIRREPRRKCGVFPMGYEWDGKRTDRRAEIDEIRHKHARRESKLPLSNGEELGMGPILNEIN